MTGGPAVAGATLVLLHPLPLDGSMWPDEVRALASRTVAPTLYDLGESIEKWAAGVLDLAGPGPLAVVGNSVGGSCALRLASAVRGVRVFHGRPDRSRFAASLDIPVLVVQGQHDRVPRDVGALTASLRHGTFRVVAGAGHYVPLERPAELAAILGEAIASLQPAT